MNSMILCSPSPGVCTDEKHTLTHTDDAIENTVCLSVLKLLLTDLMTREVDTDILPQLVGGELVMDKIFKLILEFCHEFSAWKKAV